MEITVLSIKPHEDMQMEVTVHFWDESQSPHYSAKVTVFVGQQDRALSEIRKDAIQSARDFLQRAASS